MKKTFLLLFAFIVFWGLQVNGQWSITSVSTNLTIDFDNTVAGVNQGAFAGEGFALTPSTGQLNANAWAITGFSDGNKDFGVENASGDYARGTSLSNTSEGIYAYEVETGNWALGVLPGESDFTPGTIALKMQNNTGETIEHISFNYSLWVDNWSERSQTFNGEVSLNGILWFPIPDFAFVTPEASDANGWTKTTFTGGGDFTIADGGFVYFRWNSDDNSGAGARDRIAIDDIIVYVSPSVTESDENDIVSFVLAEETGTAIIDNTAKTVTIEVASGANLAALTPTITVSDFAIISPLSGVLQDFTASDVNPVEYTVTSQSGIDQIWNVTVTAESSLSSEKDILAFVIYGQIGSTIGENTIDVEVGWQANLAGLTPTITVSDHATVSPLSGQTQNFTNPVTYTVTAEDGTTKDYYVTVTPEETPLGANCSNPFVVEIPSDLPYNHVGTTCGLGSIYNLPSTTYDNGDDAIYRLDITGLGAVVKITMSPELSETGLFLFDDCPNVGILINSVANADTTNRVITESLPTGTYYVMLDKLPMPRCFPYELTIEELCLVPTAIETANLTATSSDIHWTAGGFETTWNIKVNQGVAIDPLTEDGDIVANDFVSVNPEYTITPALTTLTTYYVYVKSGCGSDWVEYIFATPSSCPIPTDLTSTVTGASTATIAWTELGMSGWLIKVSSTSLTNPDSQIADVEDNTEITGTLGEFDLSGLSANTTYYWTVKSACGSPWATQKTFKTDCGVIEGFPFVESFDTWGTGSDAFPDCWTRPVTYGTDPVYPSCVSAYSVSSPNSLRFQALTTDPTYAVTPAFAEDINDLLVSFSLRREGANSGSIEVGVMSDPDDITSFELVQTITPASSTWELYEVMFNSTILSGSNKYIAFRHVSNFSNWYYWMDDVTVDLIPTCLKPADLAFDNVATTSVDILWTQEGTPDSWNVKVSTQSIDPSLVDGDVVANQSTTENPFTVTDLEPGTRYYFYVQANCGVEDLSYWSDEGMLLTQCDAFAVPFIQNFDTWGTGSDAFPDCWTRPVTYGTDPIYPSCVSAYSVSSPNSLRFQALTTDPTYAVTPAIAEDIHDLMVSFNLKAESTTSSGIIEVGIMSDANDITTFELVQAITPTSTSWEFYEVLFNTTTLTGVNNHIAFRQASNSSVYYYWLDDVYVDLIPSCPKPTDLFADNSTETSATLHWTENGSAISWNFKASTSPINPSVDDGEIEMTLTSNPFTLPVGTLNPSSTYFWYLQADCGDGDFSHWTEGILSTDCGISAIPYSEDFTGVPTSELPNCWTQSHSHWSAQATSNAGGTSPELKLSWSPSTTDNLKVFLPKMDATNSSNLEITFMHAVDWYQNSFDLTLEYSIDNGTTWSTAWQLASVNSDIASTSVNIDISSFVDGEIFQLAFVFSGNTFNVNYWNIDNIVVSGASNSINQIDVNSDVSDISVCKGVSQTTVIAALAPQMTITDSETNEYIVDLTWTIDAYDANSSGDYNATGSFELPVGVDQTTPATPLEVTATVTVTDDAAPTVSCPDNFTVTEQGIVALSGGLPAGGTYSGEGVTNNNFDPSSLEDGDYTITYTYTDPVSGCSNSCEFIITVDVVISINENEIAKIGVYPNPNNGKFNISFNNINGKVVYQIYDTKGSLIVAKNIYTDGNTIEEVSLSLIPGVYFVKVVTTNQSYVKKLVVE